MKVEIERIGPCCYNLLVDGTVYIREESRHIVEQVKRGLENPGLLSSFSSEIEELVDSINNHLQGG